MSSTININNVFFLGKPRVNAPISFPELKQSFFTTTSSPNQESAEKLWMAVEEKQVQVIVHLSTLEEKGVYYGDAEEEDYWPSVEGKGTKELKNGLKIELLSSGKDGSILKR